MKNREDIAIITVLYNPSSDDLEFVKGISSVYNGVIVDNSSHHNFKDQQIGKMTYIPLLKNTGIAHAQNVAIKYIVENIQSKYIMFFDQDSRFQDSFPIRMREEYESIKRNVANLGLLGPVIINKETGDSYKSVFHPDQKSNNGFLPKREIISSGNIMELNVLSDVGLMLDSMFIDFVDFEWCWRALKKNYICGVAEDISLEHKVGKNTRMIFGYPLMVWAPYRYYYQYRNFLWLIKLSYTPLQWRIATCIKFIMRFLYFPLFISNGTACVKQMIRGIKDAFIGYSEFKKEVMAYE